MPSICSTQSRLRSRSPRSVSFSDSDSISMSSKSTAIMSMSTKSSQSSTSRPRTVAISPYSELAFIPKDEMKSKWFSKQERAQFRKSLIRDSERMLKEFEDAPEDDFISRDQLLACVGIEMFVSKGLAGYVKERRREHIAAVLSEHRQQEEEGIHDAEKLACVSKSKSKWARDRARKLGVGYSKLLA